MTDNFKTTIGLEIHVQLATKTKMFCRCLNDSDQDKPNVNVCPICFGMPGTLPTTNAQAVKWTAKTGLALGCKVNSESKFDRKHYFYPDLPKGFQISQYDQPIAQKGKVETSQGIVNINRVHLEEDAGKLIHPKDSSETLVDLNRAGTPLMEVVTEPDIKSPEQAKEFLKLLKQTVKYLGVSQANMEKGELRCDANISVQQGKQTTMIVEIKNLNSFRAVSDALTYEAKRLREEFSKASKEKAKQTRGWSAKTKQTTAQRTKEEAADYRYFPEPDIPPLKFAPKDIQDLTDSLPVLPAEIRKQYAKQGITEEDFWSIITKPEKVKYLEQALAAKADLKQAINWLNNENVSLKIKPEYFAQFTVLITEGKLPGPIAKQVMVEMAKSDQAPEQIVKSKGLSATEGKDLDKIIANVLKENKSAVDQYQQGNANSIQFLIGQVMQQTKGQADPKQVQELIKQKLDK